MLTSVAIPRRVANFPWQGGYGSPTGGCSPLCPPLTPPLRQQQPHHHHQHRHHYLQYSLLPPSNVYNGNSKHEHDLEYEQQPTREYNHGDNHEHKHDLGATHVITDASVRKVWADLPSSFNDFTATLFALYLPSHTSKWNSNTKQTSIK